MKQLTWNLHTHTSRCHHAYGKDEDYVISAIQNGFKCLGFSDHVMIPNCNSHIRGDFSTLEGYVESVQSLKKRFENEIQIYLGFECEYTPNLRRYLQDLKSRKEVDYLILGQHFLSYNGQQFETYCGNMQFPLSIKQLMEYKNLTVEALRSGLFTYYAHPDIFLSGIKKFTKTIDEIIEELCLVAKECDIPMEINLAPIRTHQMIQRDEVLEYRYPSLHFLRIAKKIGVKFFIGVDAHHPQDFRQSLYKEFFKILDQMDIQPEELIKFK